MTNALLVPASSSVARPTAQTLRHLALGAVVGPVLFVLSWFTLGFVSDGYTLFGHTFTDYSPISQSISGLGMGGTAAYMNTAFVVAGLILIVGVIAVFGIVGRDRPAALRLTATILLACTGVGQIICGIFNLEAVLPHTLGFLLAMGVPLLSFPVAGRFLSRVDGWQTFGTWLTRLGSPMTLLLLISYFATFKPTADGAEHGVAGITQRALIVEVLAWFAVIGWKAYRHSRTPVTSQ
jgi:hypothetical protein